MMSDGRHSLSTSSWLAISPGIALVLLVLAISQLGDGLSTSLDPRSRLRAAEVRPQ